MRLYRGISGTAEKVDAMLEAARAHGALGQSNRKDHAVPSEVRARIADHSLTATSANAAMEGCEVRPMGYACGNLADASDYATWNAGTECAAVIAFEVHENDVTCDPLDALQGFFGAVSLIPQDAGSPAFDNLAGELETVYGAALLPYLEAARGQSPRDAENLCEVASRDLQIIRHHHANLRLVQGKGAVQFPFSSVFRVPALVDRGTVSVMEPNAIRAPTPMPPVDFARHRRAIRKEAGLGP